MSDWTTAGTAIHDQVWEQLVRALVRAHLSGCMCVLICHRESELWQPVCLFHYFENKKRER